MKKPPKEPKKKPIEVVSPVDAIGNRYLTADELGRFGRGEPLIPPKKPEERN